MPAALIATPLPTVAGVRLELFAAADQQIVISEDYRARTPTQNAPAAAAWTPTGAVEVVPWSGELHIDPTGSTTFDGAAYVERTMSGLIVGRTYQVALPCGVQGGASLTMRVDTTVPTTHLIPGGGHVPVGENVEDTADWMLFVATATTHTLRLTPGATSFGGRIYPWRMDVRWVGPNTRRLEVDFTVRDDANWTASGPAVTNGVRAVSYASHVWGPYYPTVGRFEATAGASANYAADTQMVHRTVTGLTIGRSYRVSMSLFAYLSTNTSSPTLRTRVGVVGKSETAATTTSWQSVDFVATATSHVIYAKLADAITATDTADGILNVQYVRVVDRYTDLTDIYSLVALTRSDVNGSAPVRLAADQEFDEGSLIATDYESALTGLVAYEAILLNSTTSLQERVSATATLAGQVTRPVLSPATLPQFQTSVRMVTNRYSATRASMGTVHDVIGRPDPLVTLGALKTRADSYELLVDSYEQGRAIQEVYQRGEVVLLRDPTVPAADMYHVATRVTLVPDQTAWLMTVAYVEVVRPTGPLLGALGWTFDAALTALGTFNGARAAYPTFNDYTVGPD